VKALPHFDYMILWLGACLIGCHLYAATPPITLFDDVKVKGEEIRLSDLLPENALHKVSAASATCRLGSIPALGSMRALVRAQVQQALANCSVPSYQIEIPERITVSRAGYPIKETTIRGAISRFAAGRSPEKTSPEDEVEWPRGVEAMNDDASLIVGSSRWDGLRQRWQFGMRCEQRQACGEFIVYLKPAIEVPRVRASAAISLAARSPKDTSFILTRPGQKATLLLEDGKIRISISVICLQRGRLGEQIRVLDPIRRRVFRASVLASDRLRVASKGEI
jgi:hypothetical protein